MNYYIQGDAANADKINAAFEKLGYDTSGHLFNAKSVLYFTLDGEIRATTCNCTPAIIKTHPDYKELELPVQPKFKVGDWIACDADSFTLSIKSVRDENYYFHQGGSLPIKDIDEHYHLWTIADAKDGDVLAAHECYVIFKEIDGLNIKCYCAYHYMGFNPTLYKNTLQDKTVFKPAAKEQRDLLFNRIKENGYTWDADKKELRKIIEPKFKAGDWIANDYCAGKVIALTDDAYLLDSGQSIPFSCEHNAHLWTIQDAKDGDVLVTEDYIFIFKYILHGGVHLYCHYNIDDEEFDSDIQDAIIGNIYDKGAHFQPAVKEQRDLLFAKMREAGYEWDADKKELRKIFEPQFKVGDDIKKGSTIETIVEIDYATRSYFCESGRTIWFENQDMWYLAPKPHYDIANFKPKQWVLTRDTSEWDWELTMFAYLNSGGGSKFTCINGVTFKQCIPFEGNEHLLGTTDMCDEQYINW